MDKRYQIFVSSTFADLKEERSKVIQTIMELDCIPAGMELFPAIDEEQFKFIKSIIDDCDYYILIIGGRYGSISSDGVSYTEKEYEYAIEKKIPVLAFVHANPDVIIAGKVEKEEASRIKLEKFREKISKNRMVRQWQNARELPGLVALSLPKTIKTYPAIGWVRGNTVTNIVALNELNDVRKENETLKKQLEELEKLKTIAEEIMPPTIKNLAGLDDKYEFLGWYDEFPGESDENYGWKVKITWKELFKIIAPYLLDHPNDAKVADTIARSLFNMTNREGINISLNLETFHLIKIQFKVLELADQSYRGGNNHWHLTKKGERLMYDLLSVKRKK